MTAESFAFKTIETFFTSSSSPQKEFVLLESAALVPEVWRAAAAPPEEGEVEPFRVFNPTITAAGNGYAMAYRVVGGAGRVRRLAACRLTRDFRLVPGSVTPLSDLIGFAEPVGLNARAYEWHADARYCQLGDKTYLVWNDGANRPQNHQFMAEMDHSGLAPAGPAREVSRDDGREAIEKNWMVFEAERQAWALYSVNPLEVLAVDMSGTSKVSCRRMIESRWSSPYEGLFGEMRGSAPPIRLGESFLALVHSNYRSDAGRCYRACFIRFEARPPFAVIAASVQPFELPNPRGGTFELPRLNPEVAEVVYPCGFLIEGTEAVISYGINDEACALVRVPLERILAGLQPVVTELQVTREDGTPSPREEAEAVAPEAGAQAALPLFWWNAAGKQMDGEAGGRRTFETGNFGDIASMEIVRSLTGLGPRQPKAGERKLLSVGSVLHTARNGDIVWGTGVKGSKMCLAKGVRQLSVHAVRGPLTADFLRRHGIDVSRITEVFDPGCLIPRIYHQEIEAARRSGAGAPGVRIVPHYRDDLRLRRSHYRLMEQFVSVDTTPLGMIRKLLGAERVISSSLHGIIFAEALGIPAVWLAPPGSENDLKYYDYYYGTGRYAVRRHTSLDEALCAEPMPLPSFRFDAYLATFPHEEVKALAAGGARSGVAYRLGEMEEPEVGELLGAVNFSRRDAAGLWLTDAAGRIVSHICATTRGKVVVRLLVHPFNPPELPVAQRLRVTVNGESGAVAEWRRGSRTPAELIVTVAAHEGTTPLDMRFEARNARSPRSLQISPIGTPLAVCIARLKATWVPD